MNISTYTELTKLLDEKFPNGFCLTRYGEIVIHTGLQFDSEPYADNLIQWKGNDYTPAPCNATKEELGG